ncbi:MAG: NifU family protein [Thermoplasmatota archaeon]
MAFPEEIRAALDLIRPLLQADGGDVDLVALDAAEGRVTLRLVGACAKGACEGAGGATLVGLERALKDLVPAVRVVEAAPSALV